MICIYGEWYRIVSGVYRYVSEGSLSGLTVAS